MQEIARTPKIANWNSDFLTLQKLEFQKKNPAGIFGIVNGIGIPPPMGIPEIGTENRNSQPSNKLACAQERIFGKGGNNVCTLGGLPYVVKELVDNGSRCRGPIGEMEHHLGPNAGGD